MRQISEVVSVGILDLFRAHPYPGYEKEYVKKAKSLDVWCYSRGHKCKGALNGYSPKKTIEYYESIHGCTCGAENPKVIETECMGDFDITISCPKCKRWLTRSMYDFDVKKPNGWMELCVRDWNNGISHEDMEKQREAEWERKRLHSEDIEWKPLYPNNDRRNGQTGEYCIILGRSGIRDAYGCKYTIIFQKEEKAPMFEEMDAPTEYYILFMKRFFNVKAFLSNRKSSDYGDFVRAYRTLGEAKEGALARCGWQRLNRDTLMKA